MDSRRNLRSFLPARHAELVKVIDELHRELSGYEDELHEVREASKVLNVVLDTNVLIAEENSKGASPVATEKTIKEAAVEILAKTNAGGHTANEILEIMQSDYGMTYPRSSLSPQLSRLKGDGIIGRHEGRWVLSKYLPSSSGNENGAPKGAPDTDDKDEVQSSGSLLDQWSQRRTDRADNMT